MLEERRRSIGRGSRTTQRRAPAYLVHQRLVVIGQSRALLDVAVAVVGRLIVVVVRVLVLLLHSQFRVQLAHEARFG